MPLAEAALTYVVRRVIDHMIDQATAGIGTAAATRLRNHLGREPARAACSAALHRVDTRFAASHPQWHADLFDATFLGGPAAPLLAAVVTRDTPVRADELTATWARHVGGRTGEAYRPQLEPAARDFLRWWRMELRQYEVFRTQLDGHSFERLTEATTQIERALLRAAPEFEGFVDWSSREIVHHNEVFVGRDWLFEQLDSIVSRRSCGYVHVVGAAGLGKTAFAAAVARRRDAPTFFFDASAGRTRAQQCLDHLCAELIERHGLPHDRAPAHAAHGSGFLAQLLHEAAERSSVVWLVIDAIDEAHPVDGLGNPVMLPIELPPGVNIILTHRPGDLGLRVAPGVGEATLTIHADDPRQSRDLLAYLRGRMDEEGFAAALDKATFIERVASRSEGNFMYVEYVLADAAMSVAAGDPIDLTSLPLGLAGYYRQMWRAIRETTDDFRVIECLAAAGEPVAADWLAEYVQRSPRDVRRILVRLQRFLRPAREPRRWRLIHQSFRDFLTQTEEVDLAAGHRAIADFYAERGRWEAHDGYALRHLSAHLRYAQRMDELHALVTDPDWRAAQLRADAAGAQYLADVTHCWTLAISANQRSLDRSEMPGRLDADIFCATATAEFSSLAHDVPPALFEQLVAARVWTPGQAITVLERTAFDHFQAEVLCLLGQHLRRERDPDAIDRALALARTMSAPDAQGRVLAALVQNVSDETRATIISDAFGAAERTRSETRADILIALLPALDHTDRPRMTREALAACAEIADARHRAKRLVSVVEHAESSSFDTLLADAQAAARVLDEPRARVTALTAIARRATTAEREAILHEALDVARQIEDPTDRLLALGFVSDGLSGDRATAVGMEAFAIASSFENAARRSIAFTLVAAATSADCRDHAVHEALRAGAAVEGPAERAVVLNIHARYLDRDHAIDAPDVLTAAAEMPDLGDRLDVFENLVPVLTPEQRTHVFSRARDDALAVNDTRLRAMYLTRVAPHLPDEQRREALVSAVEATAMSGAPFAWAARAEALATLGRRLPDEQRRPALSMAFELADAVWDQGRRARTLARIAPFLSGRRRSTAVAEALGASDCLDDERRADLLARIARALPAVLAAQGLRAAAGVGDDVQRATALTSLAPHLPSELMTAALHIAAEIGPERARARALAAVTQRLPRSVTGDALDAALALTRPEHRATALTALLPRLSEESSVIAGRHMRVAVEAVLERQPPRPVDEGPNDKRLAALADQLNFRMHFIEAVEHVAALVRADPDDSQQLLAKAINSWDSATPSGKRPRVPVALARHVSEDRLADAVLDELIKRDGDLDVDWVNGAAVHLPVPRLLDVLRQAADAGAPGWAEAVALLADRLPDEAHALVLAAVAAAAAITHDDTRARVLRGLARHVRGAQRSVVLADALTAARAVDDPPSRVRALAAMGLALAERDIVLAHKVWTEALRTAAREGVTQLAELTDDALGPLLERLVAGRGASSQQRGELPRAVGRSRP